MTRAGPVSELVRELGVWFGRLFPDPDRGERLSRALLERFGDDGGPVTRGRCAEVEAARYLTAALALLHGASGVVLDLRRNGGGDAGSVMLVLDWLLGGPARQIADVVYRDRTRQLWTTGRPADHGLPEDVPVAVVVGERTFSSGEALAYFIQSRGRARVVGQRTPGAADHVTPVNVTSHVRALVPEAYVRDTVTGANWERAGVVPDVPCGPAETLDVAVEHLRAD